MHYDALHYKSICLSGYRYDPSQRSEVAFFPVYPLLARGVLAIADCRAEWALLIVAHLALAGAFIGLHAYTRQRYTAEGAPTLSRNVLLAFGLVPTTFFFRMAYSESVFLAASIGTLLAIQRRLPLLWVALLSGLTTATRPVGIAFLPVFLWHCWQRSANWRNFLAHALYLAPLACWGLLAYMAYQYAAFGDPLAFAKTQQYWKAHASASLEEKAWALLILEPVWNMFLPSSERYWASGEWHQAPLFSLIAANPIYFVLTALLIGLGAIKRWLNGCEILLGVGLLLIPYLTRGYDNSMLSTGRFAAAVLPAYLVLGQLLTRAPSGVSALFAAISGFMLGAYSALFAAGYAMF
jgi:Gpi18-like mannosyltransferase